MKGIITFSRLVTANIKSLRTEFVNFALQRNINLSAGFCQQWGSKKRHRKIKLHLNLDIMADPKIEEILAPLRACVKEQVIIIIYIFRL